MTTMKIWSHHTTRMTSSARVALTETPQVIITQLETSKFFICQLSLYRVTTYTGVHTTSFRDFLLKSELSRAITECGFEHPSEVQQKCIPAAVSGEDILC